ncbi:quinone-dependent dihydroorotate dehydrogenase [Corynebacterium mendelii]|uniref:Dihydroorotate dehydrogenase (quinone) n=1 Tax=Corynebacterium mendelii TaxID=2765362 RepID=A0A939IXB0_9CORY|nr:quinone-dependent dihydroorotate dehydrogenase [Corynebacterium mendelii]MBN9643492.1 quinone-dependent dihydroorotate dehydrogenase [Corynebacterium mendelii]
MRQPVHAAYSALYPVALKAMFRLAPETIHTAMMRGLNAYAGTRSLHGPVGRMFSVDDPILGQDLFGVHFPAPLGLAAGFDKNASAADAWQSLGFGYAELGTITAKAQPGNPRPRLFRLPDDHAIINRMGFNNQGAVQAAANLRAHRGDGIIGINIGKTKLTPADRADEDYRYSAAMLGDLADYVTVNVSSPNTPGLRDLQAVESLEPILSAVTDSTDSPVLVKIAPDLSDDDVDAVADLAVKLKLAGIVATNTTITRDGLVTPPARVEAMGAGGLSGPPVAARSLEVISRLYRRVGGKLVIVGVGGIETPKQAWDRIAAGASLLQGYTGFIYGGPAWATDIHTGIADQLRKWGFFSISEAVGCGKPWLGD